VIGIRSVIKDGAKIENSVIIGADFYEPEEDIKTDKANRVPPIGIGSNTIIRNAIIDKNCRIGKNVRIVNEDKVLNREEKSYAIVDGIVVVTKNSVIPDGTVI
jgi:glucose-1-phosphate adenylyltransferase